MRQNWINLFYSAGATAHAARLATTYAPLLSCARAGRTVKVCPDGRYEIGGAWPSVRACDVPVVLKCLGVK